MKKWMNYAKMIAAAGTALAVILSGGTSTLACTGIYVGSGISENGSTYMGRSEDIGDMYGKIFGVAAAQKIEPGTVYKDAYGFEMEYDKFEYPSVTYAYTYVKDSPKYGETMADENGDPLGEAYAEAGQNEKGLSMSATVSTSYNKAAEAADPLVDTGLCEISMASLILGGAATAKEAVDLMAAILDTYGAGECNSVMFSDPNETWYFEIVSGHQYAAVKMPEEYASVQPNIMLLGVIDVTDTEHVVVSEGLVKTAEENGFLQTDENGNIDVAKTYACENSGMGQYVRYWQGLFYLNEEAAQALDPTAIQNNVNPVDLYIKPTKKLTTMDIFKLLACRGEGSTYDADAGSANYAIGNNRQAECHVFETRADMPAALATIQWQAMADAEFSVFVPYYSALLTEVSKTYDNDATAKKDENRTIIIDEDFLEQVKDSINWNFQIINYLCYYNRELCADGVKICLHQYQESLVQQQTAVDEKMMEFYEEDPELAVKMANALGKDLAQQVLEFSNAIKEELIAYLNGEKETPFVPSVTGMLPVYTVEHAQEAEEEVYTVIKGDCLWSIAASYYGDGTKWTLIYEANKGQITHPDWIEIGQKFVIPAAE